MLGMHSKNTRSKPSSLRERLGLAQQRRQRAAEQCVVFEHQEEVAGRRAVDRPGVREKAGVLARAHWRIGQGRMRGQAVRVGRLQAGDAVQPERAQLQFHGLAPHDAALQVDEASVHDGGMTQVGGAFSRAARCDVPWRGCA
jgi:hypothetical protein